MPIYEYRCSSCGVQKDVMQKISDMPLTACPACGKPTFQLKGSGWYATDFKSSGSKPESKSESAASSVGSTTPTAGGNG